MHLTKNSGEAVSQNEYARVIENLMYLTNCTRPDLAHAVNVLSRYTSNPGHAHWKAITRVLNYLRYTKYFGLHYGKEPTVLEGYSDANWISDSKNSKSTKEAEWLRNFLEDIPMWEKLVPAIRIHCDSQSAIAQAQNNLYNGKSRHIRRRHKTIRQLISTGVITILYIKSADNLADPFTKGLPRDFILTSRDNLKIHTYDPNDPYLWSSCVEERIIVFTTNHKEKLDPALLRPGRMDVHILMDYCAPNVFKKLAAMYLDYVEEHDLFEPIEKMFREVKATPAEVIEQLMVSKDPDVALKGLMGFLESKKMIRESEESEPKEADEE
uniref:AAA+ ATPase At3g28540-like C-terminal domain-containing protein n=1 Tax=Brassica oleracea TaxID=3712 RepID=A0A3P6DT03_BRAOL|nr:unnamed protein product [Brassica oleracea]